MSAPGRVGLRAGVSARSLRRRTTLYARTTSSIAVLWRAFESLETDWMENRTAIACYVGLYSEQPHARNAMTKCLGKAPSKLLQNKTSRRAPRAYAVKPASGNDSQPAEHSKVRALDSNAPSAGRAEKRDVRRRPLPVHLRATDGHFSLSAALNSVTLDLVL
jgi:hypothetical protein